MNLREKRGLVLGANTHTKVLAGALSEVINPDVQKIVLISAVSDAYVCWSENPTPNDTEAMFMAAGAMLPVLINAKYKIAVYQGDVTLSY